LEEPSSTSEQHNLLHDFFGQACFWRLPQIGHGAVRFFYFLNPKGFIQNPLDFVREPLAELAIDSETDLIFRSRIAMILIDFLQNFGVGLASLHDDFSPSSVILFVMQKNDIV
jgi:hypothetical protein